MIADPNLPLPQVAILLEAWQRLHAYVAASPVEINGFGIVERVGKTYLITKVFILRQTVTAGSADTAGADLHRLAYHMAVTGQDPSQLCFQWHSHVHGGAYCSSTDLATIDRWKGDVLISLVTNKYGAVYCRLDYFRPDRLGYIEVPVEVVLPPLADGPFDALQQEVLKLVSLPKERRFLRRPKARQLVLPPGLQAPVTVASTTRIKEV
jgi:hypothetical protein